jgi:hypothetical protein
MRYLYVVGWDSCVTLDKRRARQLPPGWGAAKVYEAGGNCRNYEEIKVIV